MINFQSLAYRRRTDPLFGTNVVLLLDCRRPAGSSLNDVKGNVGTAVGSADYSSAIAGPFGGNVLSFNGTSQQVTYADAVSWVLGTNFDLEAWVWPNNFSATQEICARRSTGNTLQFWLFRVNTTGTLRFFCRNSAGTVTDVSTTGSLTSGAWNYVRVRRSSGNVKLYIGATDTTSVTTDATTAYESNGQPLIIGAGDNVSSWFNGYVGHFRLTANATQPLDGTPIEPFPFG